MTFAEAAAIMIGGGSSASSLPFPRGFQYYDWQSSIRDYEYTGSEWIYDEYRTVPKASIVIERLITYTDSDRHYKYQYEIYQLIIDNIDTASEEVVGVIDLQTNTEYRLQLNARGGI